MEERENSQEAVFGTHVDGRIEALDVRGDVVEAQRDPFGHPGRARGEDNGQTIIGFVFVKLELASQNRFG